jgi:hypothetical protein
MMTNKLWYEAVEASVELTQGDIILNCPVVGWASKHIEPAINPEVEILKSLVEAYEIDAVVMTQGCDLENRKVENVIICPHLSLSQYKEDWEQAMRRCESKSDFQSLGKSLRGYQEWIHLESGNA